MRKERRNIEEHERRRRIILEEHQATKADLMLPAIDEKQQDRIFKEHIPWKFNSSPPENWPK